VGFDPTCPFIKPIVNPIDMLLVMGMPKFDAIASDAATLLLLPLIVLVVVVVVIVTIVFVQ
jgi:hypothetical protein